MTRRQRPARRPAATIPVVSTQLGQPLSRCRAPRMWTSGSEPMYLPRVSYTSNDGFMLFFFVAASEPVAVPRMIARAIVVLVNMVVSPADVVAHTFLVCSYLKPRMLQVNQPDVPPNRSTKAGEMRKKPCPSCTIGTRCSRQGEMLWSRD